MSLVPTVEATLDDHKKAFTEVAFLLDIFTATVDNIMGGATASVGRIAGREMARKLPIHLDDPELEEVVEMLAERGKAAFSFNLAGDLPQRDLLFDTCVIREICAQRGMEPGGPLCRIYHSYLDGMLDELLSRPVKSELVSSGGQCRLRVTVQ